MSIFILAYRVDSLTYTLAKALSYGGHEVCVQSISQEHTCDLDRRLAEMLHSTPGVRLNTDDKPLAPGSGDTLIVQGHPRIFEHRPYFLDFSRNAGKIVAITTGDRKFSSRQVLSLQFKELRWYGSRFWRVDRILYKDGFHSRDLFGLLKQRSVIGFDVHSKFLSNAEAFRKIHHIDWKSDATRPYLANFLGSRDPQRRARIMDSLKPVVMDEQIRKSLDSRGKGIFWHEFSDDAPAVLSADEYLQVLTESDFTIAPPGYSLVTHRPLEAMLRGSIPVLHASELDIYDIGLEDGINCIAVPEGEWPAAMQRIFEFPEAEIVRMRKNIADMIDTRLDYSVASEKMRQRIGLETPSDVKPSQ